MDIKKTLKALRDMQNPMEDYAIMVGAPAFACGYRYVFPEREDYIIQDAIDILEEVEKYRWHDLRENPNDLPDIEDEVEVVFVYKNIKDTYVKTARAVYEDGSITQPESAFDWEEYVGNDGECDYSEEKDEYMVPVGWFESHWCGEDCHEMSSAEIIAWRKVEPFDEKSVSKEERQNKRL